MERRTKENPRKRPAETHAPQPSPLKTSCNPARTSPSKGWVSSIGPREPWGKEEKKEDNTMKVVRYKNNNNNNRVLEVSIRHNDRRKETLTVCEKRPRDGFLLPSYSPFMRYHNVRIDRQPNDSTTPVLLGYEGASLAKLKILEYLKDKVSQTPEIQSENIGEVLDKVTPEHKSSVAEMLRNTHLGDDGFWLSRYFKSWELTRLSPEELATLRIQFKEEPVRFACLSIFQNHPTTEPWKRTLSNLSLEVMTEANEVLQKPKVTFQKYDPELLQQCHEQFVLFGNTAFLVSNTPSTEGSPSEAEKYASSFLSQNKLVTLSTTASAPARKFVSITRDYELAEKFTSNMPHWTLDRPANGSDHAETIEPKDRATLVRRFLALTQTRRLVLVAHCGANVTTFLRDLAIENAEVNPLNTLLLTPDENFHGEGQAFPAETSTLKEWLRYMEVSGSSQQTEQCEAEGMEMAPRYAILLDVHRISEFEVLKFLETALHAFQSVALFGDLYQIWQVPEQGGGCPFTDLRKVTTLAHLDLLESVVPSVWDNHRLHKFIERLRVAMLDTREPYLKSDMIQSKDFREAIRKMQTEAASIAKKHLSALLDSAVEERSTKTVVRCLAKGVGLSLLLKSQISDQRSFAIFCDDQGTSKDLHKELFNRFCLGDRVFIDRDDPTVYRITGFYTTNQHSSVDYATRLDLKLTRRTNITNECSELIYAAVIPNRRGRLRKLSDPEDPNEHRVRVTGNVHFRKAVIYDSATLHRMPFASVGVFVFDPEKVNPQLLYTFVLRVKDFLVLSPLDPSLTDVSSCLTEILSRQTVFRQTLVNQLVTQDPSKFGV